MDISVLGIDIAKKVFQLHGANKSGRAVYRKRVSRDKLLLEVINSGAQEVVMESCGSSNYWGRQFMAQGLSVKLIAPQFVKPFVKTNKTDKADAEAICEAAQRPSMRFVPIKSEEQQSVQFLHRERERVMKSRTSLCNECRGMMLELGVVTSQGVRAVRKQLVRIVHENELQFSMITMKMFQRFLTELDNLTATIKEIEQDLKVYHSTNDVSRRLTTIPGVGLLNATGLVASVGDPGSFKNGREFASWLGLVPRQHSSGERSRLGGIPVAL